MTHMILLNRMFGNNLVLELNTKMLSANQIARFLNFNISKTTLHSKVIFLHVCSHLLKLQTDNVILRECGRLTQACLESIKTLRFQKLKEV